LGGPLVGFGAFKKHCSFFVMSNTLLDTLKDDLVGFDYSGGTIRFQPDAPLPDELVKKIVQARMALSKAKSEKKKTNDRSHRWATV
jgi:uncharacterized protein YdhG (YjbR/CyaY superfamily)